MDRVRQCRRLAGRARRSTLAHLELLDLAGDGHRELVDDLDVARDLVVGDAAAAELPQRVGVDVGARSQPDPRHQLLAVAVVGHADHLDVLDVGVGVEELLDLPRVDVLAAADDHVLDPPDDVHVAVVGHHREVAGVHPAVGVDGLGRALGVVPVALHDRVAARAELAGLATLERRARRRRRRCGSRRAGGPARRSPCGGAASRRAASASRPATSRSCRSRSSPRPCACGRRTPSSPRPGTATRPSRRCAGSTGRSGRTRDGRARR